MSVEPYSKAQRVFVIVDNGSAHRGQRSIDRLQGAWPNLKLVHTPVHASWLNQAEIYFSVAQRKVLQPNNFPDLDTLEQTLLAFGRHYEQIAAAVRLEVHAHKISNGCSSGSISPSRHFNWRRDTQTRQRTSETTTEGPSARFASGARGRRFKSCRACSSLSALQRVLRAHGDWM